jgi:hypothetical protein
MLERNKYLENKIEKLKGQYEKQSRTLTSIKSSDKWKNRFVCGNQSSSCYEEKYLQLLRVRSPFYWLPFHPFYNFHHNIHPKFLGRQPLIFHISSFFHRSFVLGDTCQSEFGVRPDISLHFDEIGHKTKGIDVFWVGKSDDVGIFLSIDVLVDIYRKGEIFVDEVMALSVDDLEVGVSLFFPQHHVLKRSQGLSDLLRIVSFFVQFAPVLSLICERVVLTSFLDFILRPSLVTVHKENFFDVTRLHLHAEGEISWVKIQIRLEMMNFS